MLVELLLIYGSGIACSAIVGAVTELKKNADASLASAANNLRSHADRHKELAHLIQPLVEEVFTDFSIQKELYDLLLTDSAREAFQSELTRQATSQQWSGEKLAASISVEERFGIESQVAEFAELLVSATSRSLSQNQERWNESVGFALGSIQNRLENIDGKLDRLLEEKALEKPAVDIQRSLIPSVPASVLSEYYEIDYKRLLKFSDSRNHQNVLQESEHILEKIAIDQQYLDPRIKAAVLTCRADSLLRTGDVNEAEEAFQAAYRVSPGLDTSFNFLFSLIRQRRWDEAERLFEERSPTNESSFSWLIAKVELDYKRGAVNEAESTVASMKVETTNEILSLAEFRFQNDDFTEVERLASLALLREPENPYAKFYRGLGLGYPILEIHSEVESPEEEENARRSIQLLEEALEDFLSKGEKLFCSFIYETLANLLIRVRDGEAAVKTLDRGLAEYPGSTSLLDRKFRILALNGMVDAAVEVARKLLAVESRATATATAPNAPEAHLREPWAWFLAANYTAADAALEIASTHCPAVLSERDYILLRAQTDSNLNPPAYGRALDVLDTGIAILPQSVELRVMRAQVHQKLGDRILAEEDLSAALSLSAEKSDVREVARIYGTLKNWNCVHETITKAPIQDGMDPDLVLALNSALFTDQFGEAERLIKLADPEHPQIWTIRGIEADFLARTDKLTEALKVLDELSVNGLTAKDARINIASALGKVGKFEEAFEILRPCLILPISPDFPRLAGQLQLSLNEPTKALQYLVEAYRMDPNDAEIRKLFKLAARANRSLGRGLTLGENTILKQIQSQ